MPHAAVAVLASRVRVEEKRIFAALERRGLPYQQVDTRGFATMLPVRAGCELALSREISQSRAEYAVRLLESAGVRTVNRAEVIGVCGDKLRTSLALMRAGLPTPRTAVALTPDAAHAAIAQIGYPVVLKQLVGSWGRLLAVARDEEAARAVLEHRAALPSPVQHIVYVQELVDKPERDIRVVVVGGRALGATYRYSRDWRTNVARGAESRPCPLSDDIRRLSLAAADAVGGGVLGVDLIEDAAGGLHVLEVNHTVEFQGFERAHGGDVDVADEIVGHVCDQLAVAR